MSGNFYSFLIPPDMLPGRMSLLVTTLLILINTSGRARDNAPASDTFTLIDLWLLLCTVFVTLALFEYAIVIKVKYNSTSVTGCPNGCIRVSVVINFK